MTEWYEENNLRSLLSNDDYDSFQALVKATNEIGSDPSLVLHGGGNSSVKVTFRDVTGRDRRVLLMKASGTPMSDAEAEAFTPLDLSRLEELLPPTILTDDQFAKEVRAAAVDPDSLSPSLETLVHAAIPFRSILHSHADVLLAITDTTLEQKHLQNIIGDDIVILDYGMPGVELAEVFKTNSNAVTKSVGAVIPRHGLFTWGDSANDALGIHLRVVEALRRYLSSIPNRYSFAEPVSSTQSSNLAEIDIAALRRRLSDAANFDMLLRLSSDGEINHLAQQPEIQNAMARGPITPDHATRIKPWPMLGQDVGAFINKYETYVQRNYRRRERTRVEIDPAPRVILDDLLGLAVAAPNAGLLGVNYDMAVHNLRTISQAESIDQYEPANESHIFDLEHWELQHRKLDKEKGALEGRIAIVTGAASGIGKACASRLLESGCAVVGWDISESVLRTFSTTAWLGIQVDVTDPTAVKDAISRTVRHFGGIDILVPSAGIFPTSKPLGEMPFDEWRRTMSVNLDSVVNLYSSAAPFLKLARNGGHVAVVASKNVLAPGAGAAAYSSSKAGLTQLSRVAALEWASSGVRVNLVHPDAVFDTGLWTDELLAQRAKHYGLTVDEYKRRNLLKAEVTSKDVAELVHAMVTAPFRCTTGAQVAVDGGSDRTI